MTDEGFSIDVQAEQQQLSSTILPSSIGLSDVTAVQKSLELPQSIPLEPTKIDVSKAPVAESSKVAVDIAIKFDPETSYKELRSTVNDMQMTLSDTVNNMTNRWIPNPRQSSNFEERALTMPTNLIFEARRDRFGGYPHWA